MSYHYRDGPAVQQRTTSEAALDVPTSASGLPAASGAGGTAYLLYEPFDRSSLGSATTQQSKSQTIDRCRRPRLLRLRRRWVLPLTSTQTTHSQPYNLYVRTSTAINQEMARASSVKCGLENRPPHAKRAKAHVAKIQGQGIQICPATIPDNYLQRYRELWDRDNARIQASVSSRKRKEQLVEERQVGARLSWMD